LPQGVLLPDMKVIEQSSGALDEATARFSKAPSEATLLEARTAFRTALVRWKHGSWFLKGPPFESGSLLRATFWPARATAIDELIAAPGAVDDAHIDELAVDLKGLYALEYLLFGVDKVDSSVPPRFSGEHADRARRWTSGLAANVRKLSHVAASTLDDGAPFLRGLGGDSQASINYLVNQMARTVEDVARKLRNLLDLAARTHLKPRDVEGWPSGTSTEILATLLQGTEALYVGAGARSLAELVKPVAPAMEPRIRAAFSDARRALQELAEPVEVAVLDRHPAVERAAQAAKSLEVRLKVDLASALGVTLTFTSTDGD
jgi:predicted lipoprotein